MESRGLEVGPLEELYDLEADPAEVNNLAGERPEVLAEMRALVEQITGRAPFDASDVGAESTVDYDRDQRIEGLRALGYID